MYKTCMCIKPWTALTCMDIKAWDHNTGTEGPSRAQASLIGTLVQRTQLAYSMEDWPTPDLQTGLSFWMAHRACNLG